MSDHGADFDDDMMLRVTRIVEQINRASREKELWRRIVCKRSDLKGKQTS